MKKLRTNLLTDYIKNYDIELKSAVLNNELNNTISKISVEINVAYSEIHKTDENKIGVMVKTSIYGIDSEAYNDKIFNNEDELEQISVFNIQCIYKVEIFVNSGIQYEEKHIRDIVWFLLHPTLRETINSFSGKFGIPNIKIPYYAKKRI